MPLFDAYLIVDWSARSSPARGRDSIWLALCERVSGQWVRRPCENPPTRAAARRRIEEILCTQISRRGRVLAGFDFGLSYPQGFAAALGLAGPAPPWLQIWEQLAALHHDCEDNRNNRFDLAASLNHRIGGIAGPFWGCPAAAASPNLRRTSPRFPYTSDGGLSLERYRRTERALRARCLPVQEVWKLFYPASVGGQMLTGIPILSSLRNARGLAEVSRVWPFETGFCQTPIPTLGPAVLHVEIWPGILSGSKLPAASCRDEAQMLGLCETLALQDDEDQLGVLFAAPSGLGPEDLHACVTEEGWILGT